MKQSAVPRTAAWKAGRKAGLKAGIRVRKPRGSKATPGFAKKVLSVVARTEETKFSGDLSVDRTAVTQAGTTPADFERILARVTQGVAENQRIGDKINPVRAYANFQFWFPSTNANNQNAIVNLWIVTVKGASTAAAVNATPVDSFLQVGDGTNVDPNNPDQTLMISRYQQYPLNRDQYTLLKHYKFTMRKGIGQQANQNTGDEVTPCGVPNSEQYRQISYSWKPPALKYNASGDTLPSNHYPVALVYATNADGSAYGDTIAYNLNTQLYFKDA